MIRQYRPYVPVKTDGLIRNRTHNEQQPERDTHQCHPSKTCTLLPHPDAHVRKPSLLVMTAESPGKTGP
jgi:hypothetical protein